MVDTNTSYCRLKLILLEVPQSDLEVELQSEPVRCSFGKS